jgi:acyl transferase domain-containing protein
VTPFEPVAIVGRGCVLPGALDPDTFWHNIAHGTVSVGPVRPEDWRLPPDSTTNATAGTVRGFDDIFDPTGFHIDADQAATADPALRWVLHAARAALREAGREGPLPGAGLVLGNLGFPSRGLAAYAESVWLADRPDLLATIPAPPGITAHQRFCAGLPAHTAARALGLGAGAVTIEAACASGLYAVKLACDRLHDGTVDLMLAGAVSGCDGLIINSGFEALGGLSRTGRSRPFHRSADGLVPAEGVAVVALMRLRDAIAARSVAWCAGSACPTTGAPAVSSRPPRPARPGRCGPRTRRRVSGRTPCPCWNATPPAPPSAMPWKHGPPARSSPGTRTCRSVPPSRTSVTCSPRPGPRGC